MLLPWRQKNLKGIMVMCYQNCSSSYIYLSFYTTVYVEKFCFVLLLSFIMLAVMYKLKLIVC